MKNILLIFLFVLFLIKSSFSQDTIVMRNKTIVSAKVLEVLPSEIKYKRFEVPDGPIYTELKSNIIGIKYSNGFKEEFKLEDIVKTDIHNLQPPKPINYKINQVGPQLIYLDKPIRKKELEQLLMESNDKEIIKLTLKSKRANKVKNIGFIAIPCVVGAIGFAFVGLFNGFEENGARAGGCILTAIPFGISGIVVAGKDFSFKRRAIKLYNQKY